MDALFLQSSTSISGIAPSSIPITATCSRTNDYAPMPMPMPMPMQSRSFSRFSFRHSPLIKSLWPRPTSGYNGLSINDAVLAENADKAEQEEEGQNGNWVFKLFHLNSFWRREQGSSAAANDEEIDDFDGCRDDEEEEEEEEEEVQFNRDTFSRMLRRVSLTEARLYAQMSYLGNLTYSISSIKPRNLLKKCGLRYVTSSIEKKELAAAEEEEERTNEKDAREIKEQKNGESKIISLCASCETAVVEGSLDDSVNAKNNPEVFWSSMADTEAVGPANEETRQALAVDLNSTSVSPCEWFVCDDDQTSTRCFVIQGSESFASWQANLLFEPVQFEGMGVLVHRGIYEAAKAMYQQMLPEIHAHLQSQGSRATLRFTGHSLGGSLALLVNLMLLIRKEVPVSSLLPVITFGSPSIMCGGDSLLQRLGLPRSHVQAITLHRDIVPRAFSCKFPNHIAELLKAVNCNFRCHPCLNNENLLYAPMGELLILQPDEKFSPSHHLLPSGSGLYLLVGSLSDYDDEDTDKELRAAQLVFLNSPHPLEILSDRSAYGSGGTIQRDHDMNSYLKCVRTVIREELNQIRKERRKEHGGGGKVRGSDAMVFQDQPPYLSGMMQTGRESLKWFSRLVASQHMQLFVVLLFPARLLLFGAYNLLSLS